ncbi:hypothetical protein ADL22_12455 [Streptomyces sp. NRRL F-4489]|uniref:DUF397 domain-containing protein n=1 Tax=Streptomyces sp. NRRL F-4489 TaxID=1609095 RepID=UPI0007472DF0|nr:DUF397 domain-containing protein [Streptomyces sp. NRRL F-4489]KUL44749.1 hypothetical protein ADL22_12455 [Streptomyces sp. NRRL F-4489]
MKKSVDLTNAVWTKSDYSNGSGANCVEVAFVDGFVAIRDSNDADDPTIKPTIVSEQDYRFFTRSIQEGQEGLLLP